MKIFLIISLAILSIEARNLGSSQCVYEKTIMSLYGTCPTADVKDVVPCKDLCNRSGVTEIIECALTPECCWTGERCVMKALNIIAKFEIDGNADEEDHSDGNELNEIGHEESEEFAARKKRSVATEDTDDMGPQQQNDVYKRTKRQSGTWGGSISGQNGRDVTLSGHYSRTVGRNGRVSADGRISLPSRQWEANAEYAHTLGRGSSVSVNGGLNSYGGRRVGVGYEKNIAGGKFKAGAHYESSPYGNNHGWSVSYSKRFGRK